MKRFALAAALLAASSSLAQTTPTIHVAFLWHMHQPHYYPGETIRQSDAAGRYSYRIEDIFNQRTGPYTTWPRNAIKAGADAGLGSAGASVSFTGSLIEGLQGLEAAGNGNFAGWKTPWREAAAWRTVRGNARLDLIGFGYYHPLMPLIGTDAIARQITSHRSLVASTFSAPASRGIFTPENAFAPRIIPGLKNAGLDWVMVDNIHFERAAEGYPWTSGGNLYEPNRSDVRNPNPNDWRQLNGLWAPTRVSAWARRPHYVQYIDPETGAAQRIVAVPTDRYLGNEDGRGGFGALQYDAVMSQFEDANTDPNHPLLIVLHHDGDNFGGGSEAYYNSNFQNFVNWVKANPSRFTLTTVQDYLDQYPPAENDVIHVESGSWSGADNGDPEFQKWLGRPGSDGYSPDRNSWAVLTAATNHVATAGPGVSADALRWLDTGMASDYWYWDGTEIWDSQVTRASNEAVRLAGASAASDAAPPTVFVPQRTPYNPGENQWGSVQPKDVTVWTYAYDVSGLDSVRLFYRVDADGRVDTANETFHQHPNPWAMLAMAQVVEPDARTTPAPTARAARYEATIAGQSGVLVDYYVEAKDTKGYRVKSDIQHVWIGTGTPSGGGGSSSGPVTWTPSAPTKDRTIQIKVAAPGTATAALHWGVNAQGSTWTTPNAAYRPTGTTLFGGSGPAVETPFTRDGDTLRATLGPFNNAAQAVASVDFVIHWGDDTWDNNGGSDYHIAMSGTTGGGGGGTTTFAMDGTLDASARAVAQVGGRTLYAAYSDGKLYVATEDNASTGDAFLMVAATPGAMMGSMWGKAGQIAQPKAFLARESTNGWNGWFAPPAAAPVTGTAYANTSATVLEGVLDVATVFGSIPEAVYLAAAQYATDDGGALIAQAPAGNGDGNLDAAEFVRFEIRTVTASETAAAQAFAVGSVTPNPLRGVGRLPVTADVSGRLVVEVFDLLGRRVATFADADVTAGPYLVPVSTDGLAPGVYVLRTALGDRTAATRLVVR